VDYIINLNKRYNFFLRLSKKAKIIVSVIMIAIIAFLVYFFTFRSSGEVAVTQRTQQVRKGNLNVSITGSAAISTSSKEDLTAKVQGTLTKVNYKQGDKVTKDSILYEIDDTEAQLNVSKLENSLKQAKLSSSDSQTSLNSLTVTAPFSGVVKNLKIKTGDSVSKGTTAMTLVDESKLKFIASFSDKNRKYIKVGQGVTVSIGKSSDKTSSNTSITGTSITGPSTTNTTSTSTPMPTSDTSTSSAITVTGYVNYINNASYTNSNGDEVYNIEFVVFNSGTLTEGSSATASLTTSNGTSNSITSGTLSFINNSDIKSNADGKVQYINVREGQKVGSGAALFKQNGDSMSLTADNNNLSVASAELELKKAKDQLELYKIKAPIDGVISLQTLKVGDSLSSGTALSTISNNSDAEIELSIDELDIAKIKVDQEAQITVDAMSDTTKTPLTGKVTEVATEGTSSNGVTTYPVTIKIDKSDNLKVGMNATAEIFINKKTDILLVPIEAVTKMGDRSFVWVTSKGSSSENGNSGNMPRNNNGNYNNNNNNSSNNNSSNNGYSRNNNNYSRNNNNGNSKNANNNYNRNSNSGTNNQAGGLSSKMQQNSSYYANAKRVLVETGIYNTQYIEVKSGLSEGDTIILPQLVSSSNNTSSTQQQNSLFGGGMMGGGMGRDMGQSNRNRNNSQNSSGTNNNNGTGSSSNNSNNKSNNTTNNGSTSNNNNNINNNNINNNNNNNNNTTTNSNNNSNTNTSSSNSSGSSGSSGTR